MRLGLDDPAVQRRHLGEKFSRWMFGLAMMLTVKGGLLDHRRLFVGMVFGSSLSVLLLLLLLLLLMLLLVWRLPHGFDQ